MRLKTPLHYTTLPLKMPYFSQLFKNFVRKKERRKNVRGRRLLCREAPSLALPSEETGVGRRWGRGRFSKRSASPPDPLSRRVAAVRGGFAFIQYAAVSWARFPASWWWSRRLTEPPRPMRRGERTPPPASRAPPLSGEALLGFPPKGSLRRGSCHAQQRMTEDKPLCWGARCCNGRGYLPPSAAAEGGKGCVLERS